MQAYVISLESSQDRRSAVEQLFAAHNIAFEYIDAVDGREGTHPLLALYDEIQFIYNYGRKAAPGEIGCYASHILAWKKCVEINEPIIVFEDDLAIKDGIHSAINACRRLISTYGFIRMETTNKKPQYSVKTTGKYTLYNFIKVPQCTTCYAISPQVAKKFLEHSKTISLPVDVFIRNVWIHKQPIYGLQPFLISASNCKSIIGKRDKLKNKTLATRLICLLFKLRRMLGNGYYQCLFFIKHNLNHHP